MTMIMRERILEEKAKSEGRAEGRAEGEIRKALSVVSEMLKRNMPVDIISDVTKVSQDEIMKVKNEMALA